MTHPPHHLGGYRLASLVQLRRQGPCWTLAVDGQEFPFLVDRVADADLDATEVPTVTITLVADRVQIDNHRRASTGSDHPAAWPTDTPADARTGEVGADGDDRG